ncbi:uncharacterized protein YkwD [Hasllibacter halocynthiae]|uniref:Uncharacterized protein YkwD n=1 Tax=Hasllibacter halocynthiae TaxID=595589 RepID=A0A2T0X6J8_9RHOB|nr:CAP domain-containing protein [Hasllibacter halocynthiae]PRY94559.1 uncharacterized protein YkwD [Hasllibacter halocynthiae]
MRSTLIAILAALALSGCGTTPASGPVEARVSASGATEAQALAVTNANRRAAGLPAMRVDPALGRAAQRHARDMVARVGLSHRGSDGSGVMQRIQAEGYGACYAAENIAIGPWNGQEVAEAWLRSAGHRTNAMARLSRDVGIAQLGRAWVMVFASRC